MEGEMTSRPRRLRPSAKAVVVRDGRVLLNRNRHPETGLEWFGLPGGGQQPGETLPDTVRREVSEETGVLVEPIRLLWVSELIIMEGNDLGFSPEDHAIEVHFECRVLGEAGAAVAPDDYQLDHRWLSGSELSSVDFRPTALAGAVEAHLRGDDSGPAYRGDIS